MTENKRFRVTLESNTVRFVDFEENKQLMSISFKKHNDAIDCQNALKFQCDLLNDLNDEVKSQSLVIKGYQERTEKLFNENEQLKDALNQRTDQCDKYYKENEQLKIRFKEERERALKFGRDIDTLTVKNEQLKQDIRELQNDKLLTELQMKCDKKQEHIVLLENKIHRMREAIHKLEWLASHRNGELIRENEQLKSEINMLKITIGRNEAYIQQMKHKGEWR